MSALEALLFGVSYVVDALALYAQLAAGVAAIALVYHAPGLYRRHRTRRPSWIVDLRNGRFIRRAA